MATIGIRPKFVTDQDGREVVQLSIAQWRKVQQSLERQLSFGKVKADVRSGLEHVRLVKAGKAKAVSAKDALRELRGTVHA